MLESSQKLHTHRRRLRDPGFPVAEAAPTHLASETQRPREAVRSVPGGPEGAFGPGPRAREKKVVPPAEKEQERRLGPPLGSGSLS